MFVTKHRIPLVLYENYSLNAVFKQPFERGFRELERQLTSQQSKRSPRCLDRSCIEITLNIYSCFAIVWFHLINIICFSQSYPPIVKIGTYQILKNASQFG